MKYIIIDNKRSVIFWNIRLDQLQSEFSDQIITLEINIYTRTYE